MNGACVAIRNRTIHSVAIQLPGDGGGQTIHAHGAALAAVVALIRLGLVCHLVGIGAGIGAGGGLKGVLVAAVGVLAADHSPGSAVVGALVEDDRAGAGRRCNRGSQRDLLALVLLLIGSRVIHRVAHSQRDGRAVGLPDGIQGGVLGEHGVGTGLNSGLGVVGLAGRHSIGTGISGICAPTQELIASADGNLVDDLAVARSAGQIVVHHLLLGHASDIVPGVGVVGDGHGLADHAHNGDGGIRSDVHQIIGIDNGLVGLLLDGDGSQSQTVCAHLHVGGVIAFQDGDRKGAIRIVGMGVGAERTTTGSTGGIREVDLPAGAVGGDGHNGLDGYHLRHHVQVVFHRGVEVVRRAELLICRVQRKLYFISGGVHHVVPAAEGVALDDGSSGLGSLVGILHLLGLIDLGGGAVILPGIEGDGEGLVLRHGNGNNLIRGDVGDGVGIGLAAVAAVTRGTIRKRRSVRLDGGFRSRIVAVHLHSEGEVLTVLDRGALAGADAVAGAGGQGHGEGDLLPNGVQGDRLLTDLGGVHVTGLVHGSASSGGRPALEGEAGAGRAVRMQLQCLTINLGLIAKCSGSSGAVQVVLNGTRHGLPLAVDLHIGCNRAGCTAQRSGQASVGIPGVEGVARLVGNSNVAQGIDRRALIHRAGGIGLAVNGVGHGEGPDLRGLHSDVADVLDAASAVEIINGSAVLCDGSLRLTVNVDRSGVTVLQLDAELRVGRAIFKGVGTLAGRLSRSSELCGEVLAGGQGDGIRQFAGGHHINDGVHIRHKLVGIDAAGNRGGGQLLAVGGDLHGGGVIAGRHGHGEGLGGTLGHALWRVLGHIRASHIGRIGDSYLILLPNSVQHHIAGDRDGLAGGISAFGRSRCIGGRPALEGVTRAGGLSVGDGVFAARRDVADAVRHASDGHTRVLVIGHAVGVLRHLDLNLVVVVEVLDGVGAVTDLHVSGICGSEGVAVGLDALERVAGIHGDREGIVLAGLAHAAVGHGVALAGGGRDGIVAHAADDHERGELVVLELQVPDAADHDALCGDGVVKAGPVVVIQHIGLTGDSLAVGDQDLNVHVQLCTFDDGQGAAVLDI